MITISDFSINQCITNHWRSFSRDTAGRFPDGETEDPGYQDGLSVKTGVREDTSDLQYLIGRNFRLTLPQRTWTGQCVSTAPVRYLVSNMATYAPLMWNHFANNEPFLLLNKNYACCENQTVDNEFEIFCRIIITQFHNLANNFNR